MIVHVLCIIASCCCYEYIAVAVGVIYYENYLEFCKRVEEKTVGKVLALHLANLGLIPSTPYSSSSTARRDS